MCSEIGFVLYENFTTWIPWLLSEYFSYTPKSYYRKFGIVIKIFCLPFILLFPRNNGPWHNLSHSKDLMSFLSYQRFTFLYERVDNVETWIWLFYRSHSWFELAYPWICYDLSLNLKLFEPKFRHLSIHNPWKSTSTHITLLAGLTFSSE